MFRRLVPAVLPAAVAVALLGVGAGCTETEESSPVSRIVTASAAPAVTASTAPAPDPTGTPLSPDEIDRLLKEEDAKPRAQGRIGPFLVTADEWWEMPSCDQFHQPVAHVTESELYFGAAIDEDRPNEDVGASRCPDGTVLGIVSRPVSRSYFVGEAKVTFNFAPAERVKAITVGGFPAIVAEPLPYLVSPAALVVLERSPTGTQPGVILSIDSSNVEEMVALAEQVLKASSR